MVSVRRHAGRWAECSVTARVRAMERCGYLTSM